MSLIRGILKMSEILKFLIGGVLGYLLGMLFWKIWEIKHGLR